MLLPHPNCSTETWMLQPGPLQSTIHQALIYRPLHLLQVWWGCSATKSLSLWAALSLSFSLARPRRSRQTHPLASYASYSSVPCTAQSHPHSQASHPGMRHSNHAIPPPLHEPGTITGLNRCHTSGELKPSPLSSAVFFTCSVSFAVRRILHYCLHPCLSSAERPRQYTETQKAIGFWPIARPHQAPRPNMTICYAVLPVPSFI